MWFSKVPGYLFDKQRTPYLTEAKNLTLAQSQYELVAYGIFVASLYGIIALAATLTFLDNNNFKAPEESTFNLPGKAVRVEMHKILEKLYNDKIILDHGVKVAKELAYVLSGGDTTTDKVLSEDDLFKLELDSFMKLIEMKKTQERIKHTLATGKPLVN